MSRRRQPPEGLSCACGRTFRWTAHDVTQWNATFRGGVIVAVVCPECQTPEANAEAEVNAATVDYTVGADGRVRGKPKA